MTYALKIVMCNALYAQAQGAPAGPAGGLLSMAPMVIAMIAIMYFLMIRPQQKRDREHREMLAALGKGDEVVTTGGICGTVVGLSDDHVVLRLDEGVKVRFLRSSIHAKVKAEAGDASKAA